METVKVGEKDKFHFFPDILKLNLTFLHEKKSTCLKFRNFA